MRSSMFRLVSNLISAMCRSLLVRLLLLISLGLTSAAMADTRFRSISVDSSALGSTAAGGLSAYVKQLLEASLRQNFVGQIGGGKNEPSLIIRITGIQMNSSPDSGGGRGGSRNGGGGSDYLEGEALIIGPRGNVLLRYPMLSALNASSSGWYLKDHERNRLVALCNHYAWWLKRQLPQI